MLIHIISPKDKYIGKLSRRWYAELGLSFLPLRNKYRAYPKLNHSDFWMILDCGITLHFIFFRWEKKKCIDIHWCLKKNQVPLFCSVVIYPM